jgi:hypothetical protein
MRKWIATATLVGSLVLAAACGGEQAQQQEKPGKQDKPKADVAQQQEPVQPAPEKTQQEKPKPEPTTEERPRQQEQAASEADTTVQEQAEAEADAVAYYDAASVGNFQYTHENLVAQDRSRFTLDQWTEANRVLGSDVAAYEVTSVTMASPGVADVTVYVSGTPRNTAFVLEGGSFKHKLTAAETSMFENALTMASATASATASARASASAPAEEAGAGAGAGAGVGYRSNGKDDVNCSDLGGAVVRVGPEDEDDLDRNNDGLGCN